MDKEKAVVGQLPRHSGDGYDFGGGATLTINGVTLFLGEGAEAHQLAEEIARRWNEALGRGE